MEYKLNPGNINNPSVTISGYNVYPSYTINNNGDISLTGTPISISYTSSLKAVPSAYYGYYVLYNNTLYQINSSTKYYCPAKNQTQFSSSLNVYYPVYTKVVDGYANSSNQNAYTSSDYRYLDKIGNILNGAYSDTRIGNGETSYTIPCNFNPNFIFICPVFNLKSTGARFEIMFGMVDTIGFNPFVFGGDGGSSGTCTYSCIARYSSGNYIRYDYTNKCIVVNCNTTICNYADSQYKYIIL